MASTSKFYYEDPENISAHIVVKGLDFLRTISHQTYDDAVIEVLDQPGAERLRKPENPEDYVAIARLVGDTVQFLHRQGVVEPGVEEIRKKYTSDTTSKAWEEFKRLVDECLQHRMFMMIRLLAVFWPGYESMYHLLRWDQITMYPGGRQREYVEGKGWVEIEDDDAESDNSEDNETKNDGPKDIDSKDIN